MAVGGDGAVLHPHPHLRLNYAHKQFFHARDSSVVALISSLKGFMLDALQISDFKTARHVSWTQSQHGTKQSISHQRWQLPYANFCATSSDLAGGQESN